MNGRVALMQDLPMGKEGQLGDLQLWSRYGVRQTDVCGLSAAEGQTLLLAVELCGRSR